MNRLLAALLLVVSAPLGADTLVMKSGEKYQLKAPAQRKNGMVTFTTTANRLFSVKESEVAQEIAGPPPPSPKRVNRTDSRQLGAYAREQREEKGKTAPVAGKSGDKPKSPDPGKESKKKKSAPRDPAAAPPPAEEHR